MGPTELELIGRIALAAVCGAAIGFERELVEKPAGLRTHALVALGAAAFTVAGYAAVDSSGVSRTDTARIAAQVASGIGFLGAGIIIFHGDRVRGLTTAATIWATAAVGMAAATAQYFEAAFTTLLVLAVLMVLKPIERRLFKRPDEATLSLLMPRSENAVEQVTSALRGIGAAAQSVRFQETTSGADRLDLELELPLGTPTTAIVRQVRGVPGVHSITVGRELREDRSRLAT